MRNYATANHPGGRPRQCDATAVHTAPTGARAYVLLDGIGREQSVRDWTRTAARRLARAAAHRADAEAGLRRIYNGYAANPDRQGPWGYGPKACALVAVTAPGKPLTVAWSGDVRAYLLTNGVLRRLTQDHNLRRVYPPNDMYPEGGNRNVVTSCLGSANTDQDVKNLHGHAAIESTPVHVVPSRLLLASDGAYEPHEDAGHHLSNYLIGTPAEAATDFVQTAISRANAAHPDRPDWTDNATALVADLTP
ncbi:PP2C family serine/threonine-protein phosphatase [Streptomyces sp. TRM68367]|uniref:PP2C family protein-serine/threonine phosphatase n=1 Tax=Streptomyces sp. TRM68367 TaxID=2758415 RepID=UPI00165BFECC|nr:mucin-2 [Streptomyces sp. TRM68367]MBC9730710.1 mucin-2 [Streptomyces sp. TRM68367]